MAEMISTEIKLCHQQVAALTAQLAALRKYALHLSTCHLRSKHDDSSFCLSSMEHGCTCGLTLALRGTPNG